jgi:glycosyltransferase involved in cell wall biosynthesis
MKDISNIKIFVDAHVLDGPHQGTRTFIEQLYRELVHKPGIELFIAARNISELKNAFDNNENIQYLQYKSFNRVDRLLIEIPYLLKKHKIDYAHFQYITPFKTPCKTIVTTHDVIFTEIPDEYSYRYKKIKKYLYRRSVKQADIVTTVSEHSRTSIEKNLSIPKEKIHLIQNGIHKSYFNSIERLTAREYVYDKYALEKFLLSVSRIEPRKNHAQMVRVFSKLGLAAKGFYLVFLGNKTIPVPELENELKKLSSKEREMILIRDDIDSEELKYFMRAASLFLYPSKGEGFGIPPLEAAALQTPVICSNATAMRDFDFFEEDHIDPSNEQLLEERIAKLINHPPAEEILARRSDHIRENYSWQKSADQFYQLIQSHHFKK